ncbi:MAG: outer membrane protein assembly factor [Polyangiales bacterium]
MEKSQTNQGDSRLSGSRVALMLLVGAVFGGCAHVPADRYAVDHLNIEGMEEMDEYALRACLATSQRSRTGINLSRSTRPACNEPPFEDAVRVRLPILTWRSGWPLYDRSVFERDLQRIRRWYRARGYYDANVETVSYDPPIAATEDRVDVNSECDRVRSGEGCELEISVVINEGQPVMVAGTELQGAEALSAEIREDLADAISLEVGQRFDEQSYEATKAALVRVLHNATFACASVDGDVQLDETNRVANVTFTVSPGVEHVIGDVTLSGERDLRRATIIATANIDEGEPFTDALLADARHAVYALGAFASVDIIPTPRREEEACTGVVDVAVQVSPGRRLRYGLGGGLQSGVIGTGSTQQLDSDQWDIHLLGFIEHRNFLGGLRRFRIEERPKLIFPTSFPRARAESDDGETLTPSLGNELRFEFRQPAFIEARTTLVVSGRWDFGPDPNLGAVVRHSFDADIALQRSFFDGRLSASIGVHYNLYLPTQRQDLASDSQLFFFKQQFALDLRDNSVNPRLGLYFGLDLQEASFLDWNYMRIVPDVRAYVPLGPLVLAGRFRLGYMHIFSADGDLDRVSQLLGPVQYRLRGGGASSHRGFQAGFMGDQFEPVPGGDPDAVFAQNAGGLRRWGASLELRFLFNDDFGAVAFADIGDINRMPEFRFSRTRLALGFGLRYQTLIGPFRLDVAFLANDAQVDDWGHYGGFFSSPPTSPVMCTPTMDPDDPCDATSPFGGAIHLTIGEAF